MKSHSKVIWSDFFCFVFLLKNRCFKECYYVNRNICFYKNAKTISVFLLKIYLQPCFVAIMLRNHTFCSYII